MFYSFDGNDILISLPAQMRTPAAYTSGGKHWWNPIFSTMAKQIHERPKEALSKSRPTQKCNERPTAHPRNQRATHHRLKNATSDPRPTQESNEQPTIPIPYHIMEKIGLLIFVWGFLGSLVGRLWLSWVARGFLGSLVGRLWLSWVAREFVWRSWKIMEFNSACHLVHILRNNIILEATKRRKMVLMCICAYISFISNIYV